MKRYLLKRILFSIFSLSVVMLIVMFLTYQLMDRSLIFTNDAMISRLSYNELEMYMHNKYVEYGYEEYVLFGNYLTDVYKEKCGEEEYTKDPDYKAANSSLFDPEAYAENKDVKAFKELYESKGFTVEYMAPVKVLRKIVSQPRLIAVRQFGLFERFGVWASQLIKIETINDVKDPNLTDRYIRWEWDKRSNMPALVGSGTMHKYLIYFDDEFPFVHQNLVHLQFGKSNNQDKGVDVFDSLNTPTGASDVRAQEYPVDLGTGITHETAYDFHTVTYTAEPFEGNFKIFGENEHYANASYRTTGLTRIGNSFVIGIFALIVSYLFGLPLGIWMAQRKDKLLDKLGNAYIVFIAAVPSLAYIFIFQAIGVSAFGLPSKWGDSRGFWLTIILPVVSLALPSLGGLMKWMRRFMIDQANADYVKFARATGMTEGEIFSKHIARNAFIFLVHGLPADLLFALTGALITERVYAVPGVGGLVTNGITKYDNGVIIGGTLFYAVLTILALILGDLLLAKYDPRVSLTNERG